MPRRKPVTVWIIIVVFLVGAFTPVLPACAALPSASPGQAAAVDPGGKGLLTIAFDLLLVGLLNKLIPGLGDKIAAARFRVRGH